MTTYARIIDNTVIEVIDFDPAGRFTGEIVALFTEVPDGTGQQDTLNQDGTWTKYIAPPEPEPLQPPAVRTLTKLEYMDRFTDTELAGIYTAAKSVVQVEIWLEKFKLATEVNLDDPRTLSGLQAMEAAGLLAAGRASEITA